jgi:hypothetical protein
MKQYVIDVIHVMLAHNVDNSIVLYNLDSAWKTNLLDFQELHDICLFHGIDIRKVISKEEVDFFKQDYPI